MFEKEAGEYLFDRLDPKAIDSVSEFSNNHSKQLEYAKTIIKDLLDNSDEYARQRAWTFWRLKNDMLRAIDKPRPEGGRGYVIGDCNCCDRKGVRVYFFERRYGRYGEKLFIDKLCRECWMKADEYAKGGLNVL